MYSPSLSCSEPPRAILSLTEPHWAPLADTLPDTLPDTWACGLWASFTPFSSFNIRTMGSLKNLREDGASHLQTPGHACWGRGWWEVTLLVNRVTSGWHCLIYALSISMALVIREVSYFLGPFHNFPCHLWSPCNQMKPCHFASCLQGISCYEIAIRVLCNPLGYSKCSKCSKVALLFENNPRSLPCLVQIW